MPNLAEAWLGCGNVFSRFRRYDELLAAYDKAATLRPDLAEAWLGRGNLLSELGRYDDASAAYDKALILKPDLATAWLGRAHILTERKRCEEALAAYDKAVALKADLNYAAGARLFLKLFMCDWTNLAAEVADLLTMVRERKSSTTPFTALAIPSSTADQLQCATQYIRDQPVFPPLWRGEVYAHDRIRVAYLSADFHETAMASLLAGLFEQHDRSRFDITALSFGPDRTTAMRHRLTDAFEHFIDVRQKSDEDIAELVRRLEIDIAVDLMGFTRNNRLGVFARRPAPIQVNYLGFPGTMAADYIDYMIADLTIVPEGQSSHYSEQVIWLPQTYLANDNRRPISERTPTRRECAFAGECLHILLLQQYIQDHARGFRYLDEFAETDERQRSLDDRGESGRFGQSAPGGGAARRFIAALDLCPAHHVGGSLGAPPAGGFVPGYLAV